MKSITETPEFDSGKAWEIIANLYFHKYRGWDIKPTTTRQERVECRGDYIYTKPGVRDLYVEHKADFEALRTGNIFLETVSVDNANKKGWIYTSTADTVLYALPFNHKVLVCSPQRLNGEIESLRRQFREVPTYKNDGYITRGLLVPIEYAIKNLVEQVIEI